MAKTPTVFPDNDGDEKSGVSKGNKYSPKFNEKALCRAFVMRFHTMGILTSAETGLIINSIDQGGRPTL